MRIHTFEFVKKLNLNLMVYSMYVLYGRYIFLYLYWGRSKLKEKNLKQGIKERS